MDQSRLRNNSLYLMGMTLSCLLLSSSAVPSSRVLELEIAPSSGPSAAAAVVEPTNDVDRNVRFFGTLLARAAKEFSPEILRFCTGTENPTLCAETIAPYLEGSFDPVKALETEIKATLEKASEIAAVIKQQLEDPATAKNALDALGICQDQYGDMLETMKEVLDIVAQENVVDAYYKFSSVISDKSSCDDAFEESPGVDMPFAQDSTALFQLGGNVLAIMDAIVNNHKM